MAIAGILAGARNLGRRRLEAAGLRPFRAEPERVRERKQQPGAAPGIFRRAIGQRDGDAEIGPQVVHQKQADAGAGGGQRKSVADAVADKIGEAALDLGASRLQAFRRVTLPLSLPGVIAAFFFVFIPTLGEFITPSLVGGATGYMYGNQIVDLFGTGFPDWETGAVLAMFLLGVVTVLTVVFARFLQPRQVVAD